MVFRSPAIARCFSHFRLKTENVCANGRRCKRYWSKRLADKTGNKLTKFVEQEAENIFGSSWEIEGNERGVKNNTAAFVTQNNSRKNGTVKSSAEQTAQTADVSSAKTDPNIRRRTAVRELDPILTFPLLEATPNPTELVPRFSAETEVPILNSEEVAMLDKKSAMPSVSLVLEKSRPPEEQAMLDRWKAKMISELGEEGFAQWQKGDSLLLCADSLQTTWLTRVLNAWLTKERNLHRVLFVNRDVCARSQPARVHSEAARDGRRRRRARQRQRRLLAQHQGRLSRLLPSLPHWTICPTPALEIPRLLRLRCKLQVTQVEFLAPSSDRKIVRNVSKPNSLRGFPLPARYSSERLVVNRSVKLKFSGTNNVWWSGRHRNDRKRRLPVRSTTRFRWLPTWELSTSINVTISLWVDCHHKRKTFPSSPCTLRWVTMTWMLLSEFD